MEGISAPTASRLLEKYHKEGLLIKKKERIFIFYRADKASSILKDIAKAYWRLKLKRSGILNFLDEKFNYPAIILFGSLSKNETKNDSDIDLAIFTKNKKEINLKEYEKKIGRNIQLFIFSSLDSIKNKDLKINIINGYNLSGLLR